MLTMNHNYHNPKKGIEIQKAGERIFDIYDNSDNYDNYSNYDKLDNYYNCVS